MTSLSRRLSPNPRARAEGQLPVSFGEGLGAAFDLAKQTALGGLGLGELERDAFERGARPPAQPSPTLPLGGRDLPTFSDTHRTPVLSADVLNERYKHLGLTFDRPMSEGAAASLADGKRAEIVRQDILRRAPGGIANVGYFGAGLAALATDPLELAAAFIPGVGAARTAWLVSRLGRVGGRATAGAIGGAGANAALEPFILGLSERAQLDYTMGDALMSVAFGGLIGSAGGAIAGLRRSTSLTREGKSDIPDGLFQVTPRVPDAVAQASPRERMAAFRASIAQVAQGRTVRVAGPSGQQIRPPSLGQFLAGRGGVRDERGELSHIGADEWHRQPRARGEQRFRPRLVREDGEELAEAARAAHEAGFIPDNDVRQLLDALSEETSGRRVVAQSDALEEAEFAEAQARPLEAEAELERIDRIVDEFPDISPEDAARVSAIMQRDRVDAFDAFERMAIEDEARAMVESEAGPGREFSGDEQASRRFAEVEDFDPLDEGDELLEMVGQMRDSGVLSKADLEEVSALDALSKRAAAISETVRAAAVCMAR